MVQVERVIASAAREASGYSLAIPRPFMAAYMVMHKIHRVWRWLRLGKIYSNPDNFLKLAAGHSVNSLFGDSLLLRISAVCVLIATRILECVEQQARLQCAWRNLSEAWRGQFTPSVKIKWEKRSSGFLSASTITWWRFQYRRTISLIARVSQCVLRLIKESFVLSMRIIDAIETFYLSPATQNEGINLFFVNGAKWIEKLVDNKEILMSGLVSNKRIIDKILKEVHSPFSSNQLIKTTESALEKTKKVYNAVEGASSGVGMFITSCGKKWGYEFLHTFGLHHLVPTTLVPPSRPPWETPPHKGNSIRYPSIDKLTKPSKKGTGVETGGSFQGAKKTELPWSFAN